MSLLVSGRRIYQIAWEEESITDEKRHIHPSKVFHVFQQPIVKILRK